MQKYDSHEDEHVDALNSKLAEHWPVLVRPENQEEKIARKHKWEHVINSLAAYRSTRKTKTL
jgi:hypothetical protein